MEDIHPLVNTETEIKMEEVLILGFHSFIIKTIYESVPVFLSD